MRKILLIILFFLAGITWSQNGGLSCQDIQPLCSNSGLNFTASSGDPDAMVTDPTNDYGCLGSAPNPSWYYIEVSQPGDIIMSLTAPSDIDFIIWGPFSSLADAQNSCGTYSAAEIVPDINCLFPGFQCDSYGCSFSGSNTETPGIPSAQVGEVYVMLITNYSNNVQNITLNQTGGSGETDCSIVTPTCSIDDFTATIGSCNLLTGNFNVDVTIDFSDAPSSGDLVVEDSTGTIHVIASAPFSSGTETGNFSLVADGNNWTINAYFTADAACLSTINFDAPPCDCPADVGTYNINVIGNSNTPSKLCFGDQITVTSNNNWTSPNIMTDAYNPASPAYDVDAPVYDPGINWLVYSCPPTISLTPSQLANNGLEIGADPCLVGTISNTPNFSDPNNLSIINSFPSGTFTNNVVYFVPLTIYSLVDNIYTYIVPPADPCFEMGTPVAVQYLPEITYTSSFNCANGTASITLNGGSPQLNGTNFTIVPGSLVPNTASFVNTSTGNGGTIVIGNLTTGSYSFEIVDDAGCPKTITGNFIGPQSADINYSKNAYCLNSPNDLPILTGTPGGTYSVGLGLNLNPTTGEINFANSTPGSYTITYTTPGPLCPVTSNFNLSLQDFPIVDGGPDQTLCIGTPVLLAGSGADIYDWSFGLQDGLPYLPSLGETEFSVVGSTIAGCEGYDTVVVTVINDCNPEEEVVLWVPNTFTPDGDQYNQSFKPIFYSGYDPFEYTFYIYNRWGEIIWESNDVSVGWDGTYFKGRKVAEGTYTWKIRFKLINNDEKRTVVGHVNVLR